MAKSEHRRQAKLEKKRMKKQADRKDRLRREAQFATKKKEEIRDAYGTTAYCWPILYRALFFTSIPDLSRGIDFTGTDLQLKVFETQAARRADEGGEVVSSLRIDSCTAVNFVPLDNTMKLECTGNLATLVSKSSVYGRWYRKQWGAKILVPDSEDYQEVSVNFTLHLVRHSGAAARAMNRFLSSVGHIPFTAGAWNILEICIPENLRIDGNALDTERLQELLLMLRIWTPMLTLANFEPPKSKGLLEEDLERLEREEREAAAVLAPLSAESERLLEAAGIAAHALHRQKLEMEELYRRYQEAEAVFHAVDADSPDKEFRIRTARREMILRRDNWLSAKVRYESAEKAQRPEVDALERQFVAAMEREFAAANAFTHPFLHWQRIRAYLTVAK